MYGSFSQFGGLALSMRLFLAAVVSVTVMVADARFDLFKDWRNWFMDVSTPFIYSAESPSIFLSSAANSFTTKGAYAREIRSLRDNISGRDSGEEAGSFDEELRALKIDITSLRSDILRYQALKRENEHLRALLESPVRFDSGRRLPRYSRSTLIRPCGRSSSMPAPGITSTRGSLWSAMRESSVR